MFMNGMKYEQSYRLIEPYRTFNIVGIVLFISMHWLFTSHYLKVACLFKLAYRERDLLILKVRSKVLKAISFCIYLGCLILFTLSVKLD